MGEERRLDRARRGTGRERQRLSRLHANSVRRPTLLPYRHIPGPEPHTATATECKERSCICMDVHDRSQQRSKRTETLSRRDRSPVVVSDCPHTRVEQLTMSSSDSSFSSSFFSSAGASSAAAAPPAAGAPPATGAPPPPTLVRSSLTSLPSRALARRLAQTGSTSRPAAWVMEVILSPVISTPSSATGG